MLLKSPGPQVRGFLHLASSSRKQSPSASAAGRQSGRSFPHAHEKRRQIALPAFWKSDRLEAVRAARQLGGEELEML
jgi:hypothetical protein